MRKRKIVSDFDGTGTDVILESETFNPAYTELFSHEFHLPFHELERRIETAKDTINSDPGSYGWKDGEIIIAPATADPYIYLQTAATLALESMAENSASVLPRSEWDSALVKVFREAYAKSGVFFRPFAKEYFQTLNAKSDFAVVTNSSTNAVEAKLAMLLGADNGIKVLGGAKKFKLVPEWYGALPTIRLAGLKRPVYLRRRYYADILASLGDVTDVCGDIYELDLALPEFMGINTTLITTEMTAPWEKAHYLDNPSGIATPSLEVALEYLLSN